MRRREFFGLLGGAITWPLAADAQQPGKMPRIGILNNGPAAVSSPLLQGLHALGYTEGQNLTIEVRFADWKLDRLPDLATELVALKVDVIVAAATPAARAAKQATGTIPIVAISMGDPVNDELVASLGSPGGNVTGTTFLGPELVAKRFGLLKAALPGVSRVAALWHPGAYGERTMKGFLNETEVAARSLGVQLQLVQALAPADFDPAFSAMAGGNADALIVLPSPMLFAEHRRIVELAGKNRLPAMYQAREFVDAGGLMAYGANLPDLARRAATYVDKILKGAKPADLPRRATDKVRAAREFEDGERAGADHLSRIPAARRRGDRMRRRELMIPTGERGVGTIAALRGPGAHGALNLPSPAHVRQVLPRT